jgi:hypothetical protein
LVKLDEIAPEKKPRSRWRRIVGLIGILVTVCFALFVCSVLAQSLNIIPDPEESRQTREVAQALTSTIVVATEQIQETQASQLTREAVETINTDMTNIALTPIPPTATTVPSATITNTRPPTSTTVPRTTPPTVAATIAFNEAEYAEDLYNGLFLTAGGRNIDVIRVADGRANGGERSAIITYLTTEVNEVGYVDEWIDIFSGVAATIEANDLDLDSVSLVMGTATGQAVAIIATTTEDLLMFHRGEISRAEFLSRLITTEL